MDGLTNISIFGTDATGQPADAESSGQVGTLESMPEDAISDNNTADIIGSLESTEMAGNQIGTENTEQHPQDNPSDIGAVPGEEVTNSEMVPGASESDTQLLPDGVDSTVTDTLDYTSQLETIQGDITQIRDSVLSVSGNTYSVTISGNDLTTQITDNQTRIMDNQLSLINIATCILLAVLFDIMTRAAKRIIKGMVNNE